MGHKTALFEIRPWWIRCTIGGTLTQENHRAGVHVMKDDTSSLDPIQLSGVESTVIHLAEGRTKTRESRDKDKREKGCPFDGRTDGQRQER